MSKNYYFLDDIVATYQLLNISYNVFCSIVVMCITLKFAYDKFKFYGVIKTPVELFFKVA
jgi:hypothetical protein